MSELNAQDSKCWNCKYGLCVKESSNESIIHEGMNLLGEEGEAEEMNLFGDDMVEFKEQDAEPELQNLEHNLKMSRVRTVCNYLVLKYQHPVPIIMASVEECSRFEPNEVD